MEVGSSSLPGTTHRTLVQCAQATSLRDYISHDCGMWAGSVDVAFNIVDNNIKLYQSLKPFIGGLAQLARALAWHARGHRFDPDILHFALDLRMRSLTY